MSLHTDFVSRSASGILYIWWRLHYILRQFLPVFYILVVVVVGVGLKMLVGLGRSSLDEQGAVQFEEQVIVYDFYSRVE